MQVISFIAFATAAAQQCPGSPSTPHAKATTESTFTASCDTVKGEIRARIAGSQAGTWVDPHNGGKYMLIADGGFKNGGGLVQLQRVTGGAGLYTDLIDLKLTATGASRNPFDDGCVIEACSESQSQSVTDFSSNYCNQRNLYCGSDVGCVSVKSELAFTEKVTYLSPDYGLIPGATSNAEECIVATRNVTLI